eukprot:COSAG02_NODE_51680_length_312_cov_1.211268_1_plen_21_part_10
MLATTQAQLIETLQQQAPTQA